MLAGPLAGALVARHDERIARYDVSAGLDEPLWSTGAQIAADASRSARQPEL